MPEELITYEQPLNEHIRACLRLEHLFEKARQTINSTTQWGSRAALAAIIEILNVIDRPDLKAKLTKALTQHTTSLSQLESSPGVDRTKLNELLSKLDSMIDSLHAINGKLGEHIRNNEFLNSIRLRMAHPGGACDFSVPNYQLWLEQPAEERIKQLNTWLSEFDQLQRIIELLLQLTRSNSTRQPKMAQQGFYQQAMNALVPWQLVRIKIPKSLNVYPEISVGRHRMSIRFFPLDATTSASQIQTDIRFELYCCCVNYAVASAGA